ncbi:hypothetical protein HPO96_17905 [Kribbella sandramycini]|uniref:Uncharacterized protein n=1 Tax=Kribbella sandramycini TaxID=60450 RepID=A0A7Y4P0Q1_9ACTN|nr:hypothetical protein [Kribbella sandramycini]MBB6565859.1 hypothetical protein [Kribbella sandramycini]NOL42123.1 hypothetical protein [Kribbella sandramycini]
MNTDDWQYIAIVSQAARETAERPGALWRRQGDVLEYLSFVDWTWHPGTERYFPLPSLQVTISAEQAEELLADRQRFVKYWVLHESRAKGDPSDGTFVYRRLSSPDRLAEQYFWNTEWTDTTEIHDFLVGGPHDVPDLKPIDAAEAERIIQETTGVVGATDL